MGRYFCTLLDWPWLAFTWCHQRKTRNLEEWAKFIPSKQVASSRQDVSRHTYIHTYKTYGSHWKQQWGQELPFISLSLSSRLTHTLLTHSHRNPRRLLSARSWSVMSHEVPVPLLTPDNPQHRCCSRIYLIQAEIQYCGVIRGQSPCVHTAISRHQLSFSNLSILVKGRSTEIANTDRKSVSYVFPFSMCIYRDGALSEYCPRCQ